MNTSASEPVFLAEIERIQRERLAAVVLLTERMLMLARAGDWDQVSDSERCRQTLLNDCFESEVQPHNSQLFSGHCCHAPHERGADGFVGSGTN